MSRRFSIFLVAALAVILLVASLATGSLAGTPPAGSYRLSPVSWQVDGILSGAGYQLQSSSSPGGTGTQCCCTLLPCILK